MKTLIFSNRLDDSNGSIKNGQNDKMQTSDQSPKTPWFLRLPEAILRKSGLLAVLAIGVDAAASFLKTKMEKAAAVASKVGAAILKSKKAISAAATAILVAIQPKPQKIAENRLAKGKACLASATILALLAGIATPQLNAWMNLIYLPFYERVHYVKVFEEQWREGYQHRWKIYGYYRSEYFSDHLRGVRSLYTGLGIFGYASKETDMLVPSIWRRTDTIYFTIGAHISRCFARNSDGKVVSWACNRSYVELVPHKRVGRTHRWWKSDRDLSYYDSWERREYHFKVAVPKTDPHELGPYRLHVGLSVVNENIPREEPNSAGVCSTYIVAYPGPLVFIDPCLPSNMSWPENGYLTYDDIVTLAGRPGDNDE